MTPTPFAKIACVASVACAAPWQGAAQSEPANAQVTSANKAKIDKATAGNQIGCHIVGGALTPAWNLQTTSADGAPLGFIASGGN